MKMSRWERNGRLHGYLLFFSLVCALDRKGRCVLNKDQSKKKKKMLKRCYFGNSETVSETLNIYLLIATSSAEALVQETLKLYGEQIYHVHMDKICLSCFCRLNSPISFRHLSYQRCFSPLVSFGAVHWASIRVTISVLHWRIQK